VTPNPKTTTISAREIFRFWKISNNNSRPLKGESLILMIKHQMLNQCTKLEVCSFAHSGDILGGSKKKLMDHMTVITPLLGVTFYFYFGKT